MPLQKIVLKPGVNRENTRYTNEGGYYESEKVRFRQGTPEKIGGWQQISTSTYTGVCRSLWNWTTLAGANLIGVGTENLFYISQTGLYYDVTPVTDTHILGAGPITTVNGSSTVTVTDSTYHPAVGDYVIFSGAATFNNVTLNGQYQVVTAPAGSTYTVTAKTVANASSSDGGSVVYASYLLNAGNSIFTGYLGWGAGAWGSGVWSGVGAVSNPSGLKIWTQYNFGQDLLMGPKNGAMYYWNATTATTLIAPTTVTLSNTSPVVGTLTTNTSTALADGTALMFETTGALPTPLKPLTTYYVKYLTSTTFDLTATPPTLTFYASCSGAGANTLNVTSITGTIVAGMTVYYPTGVNSNQLTLGTISFTGTGTGKLGTYSVSAGVLVAAVTMGGSTVINATGAGSGVHTISIRAIPVAALVGADAVPTSQYTLMVSDTSRFTFAFGTNDYLSTVNDPMLVRWSDQESITSWAPAITNQAGSIRLSHGSLIQTVLQARQEILVFTDAALYSLQYLGAPYVWSSQLLSDNISVAGLNAAAYSNGTAYWMGQDKFYKYDGRVQTLVCDLRQYVYNDLNRSQFSQIFAGTNEGFNEIWWFYCSENSITIDRYVIFNYVENVWYYGTMARTAWLDSSLISYPIAATYANNLVWHEYGVDDGTLSPSVGFTASITTAQFDIGDGHNYAFIWRMLPDLTFRGSSDGLVDGKYPSLNMQLQPLQTSGSGYNTPKSIAGTSSDATQAVTATNVYPIDAATLDQYNGQVNIRVRGRQMSMKIESTQKGTQWQLGSPRLDIRQDGRRGS